MRSVRHAVTAGRVWTGELYSGYMSIR